jgi:hypothetical protein
VIILKGFLIGTLEISRKIVYAGRQLKTVHDLLKKGGVRRPGEDFLGENVLLKGNVVESDIN